MTSVVSSSMSGTVFWLFFLICLVCQNPFLTPKIFASGDVFQEVLPCLVLEANCASNVPRVSLILVLAYM